MPIPDLGDSPEADAFVPPPPSTWTLRFNHFRRDPASTSHSCYFNSMEDAVKYAYGTTHNFVELMDQTGAVRAISFARSEFIVVSGTIGKESTPHGKESTPHGKESTPHGEKP